MVVLAYLYTVDNSSSSSLASAERSLSKLKLIKDLEKSTMSQYRLAYFIHSFIRNLIDSFIHSFILSFIQLEDLAMLSIESNIARTIDFDAVIQNLIEKAGN